MHNQALVIERSFNTPAAFELSAHGNTTTVRITHTDLDTFVCRAYAQHTAMVDGRLHRFSPQG